MKISLHDIEVTIRKKIFPDLLKGRQDFDLPHTKAVVFWIKQILKTEPELDKLVLITAAYAHDWGYINMGMSRKVSIKDVHKAKAAHMIIGAERIGNFLLNNMSISYTPKQINRVKHLVLIHDRLDIVKADDEIALVEADTLGALDTDRVKPTFSKDDNDAYIKDQVMTLRRPLFRHKLPIKVYEELLHKRLAFYQ